MSLRDVKEYYFQVQQQFFEMNQTAKELNEECAKGNVSQVMVDQANAMTLPLKQNYERLSYIMYLFSKPNRKKKAQKYDAKNQETLKSFKFLKADEASCNLENKETLKEFKIYVNDLKENL